MTNFVFEVPDDQVGCAAGDPPGDGQAHPAVRLKVPLVVEARAAQNWDEAH